tara:strand:+ start:1064 stop:1714 length:651 start_codon:yes stop_codon:yes gene_type:complete
MSHDFPCFEDKSRYSAESFYEIVERYNLTSRQAKNFLTSWNDIRSNRNCPYLGDRWYDMESRRPMSRDFYEHLLNKPSGFMTKAAKDILNDPLLDKQEKAKLTTADHVLSGQTWGTFVVARYTEVFEDDFPKYVGECLTASQTVISTVEENNRFKEYTVNDKTTGGTLRLRVPTEKRYEAAGINKLWNKNIGYYVEGFPFELSEEYLDFEKEYLLI